MVNLEEKGHVPIVVWHALKLTVHLKVLCVPHVFHTGRKYIRNKSCVSRLVSSSQYFKYVILHRRTGSVRPTMGPAKPRDRQFHVLLRHKRKPPRGMFINHDDLVAMASGPAGQGEQMLRTMDREIVSLKRQVSVNLLQ